MVDVFYSPQPTGVTKFLDHLQGAGVPKKVNRQYLTSVGFNSSNDRYTIPILKKLGFLESDGTPTPAWGAYRNRQKAPAVLNGAIRTAYQGLFDTYPDANRRDTEAIRNFFSSHSDLADATLTLAVRTFTELCKKADFETEPAPRAPQPAPEPAPEKAPTRTPEPVPPEAVLARTAGPSVNINIELHLPATNDPDIYDRLFEALKRHLFTDGTS